MDLPFEPKKVILSNGETLSYRERFGEGPCMLLIHGNMASSQLWEPFMEQFDPSYRLIAVDLRGYGDSTYHQPVEAIKDFSYDLALFADQLELGTFHVMGWSNGGGVAMQFAADFPERVQNLILLSSMSTRGYALYNSDHIRLETREQIVSDPGLQMTLQANENQDRTYFANALNYLVFQNTQPDEHTYNAYVEPCIQQRNMVDVAYAANRFNISTESNGLVEGTGEIRNIESPVLVLWGKKDLLTTEQMTAEIVEDFTAHGKHIACSYLDTGHSPLLDDLPGLIHAVHSFLER